MKNSEMGAEEYKEYLVDLKEKGITNEVGLSEVLKYQ
jgi:hypothetical protein